MSCTIQLPPYADLLGLEIERGDGAPVLTLPFRDQVVGRPGLVHGGAIGGLLEMAAMGALLHALDGEAARIKPVTVTVDYMRGGRGRATYARGAIVRLGNRVANVDAFAWQESEDKPIARARLNYLLERPVSPE
jgi:uncharacterized protein (TIGR00369 family)